MPQLTIILALIVLVIVHELGHFIAARRVGILATKFYVFFPPAAFKKTIRGVEYGIGMLPLGGFVKLPGMFEPVPEEVAKRVGWELEAVGDFRGSEQELTVDAAVRSMERAASPDELVEPLIEVRDAIATRRAGFAPERTAEAKRSDKAVERIQNLLDDCSPKAYWRADLWRRMVVIFAGPLVNILVAFVLLFTFYSWLQPVYQTTMKVRVEKSTPASEAGLSSKSTITAWNGRLDDLDIGGLNTRISDGIGKPTKVSWRDPGVATIQTATIVPRDLGGDGSHDQRIGVNRFGFDQAVIGRDGVGPVRAATGSLELMRELTWGNLKGIAQLVYKAETRKQIGGVVGIVDISAQVHDSGRTLQYVGIISLVLAVMNLLPLLPLDGGHILFGIIEFFRRKPLPRM
ncbi:MAG: site-2 protease family protein, partial [Thermoleophilia bacterium]|nr:site-2 protease family protein [Thermoleophilia bacterium]